MPYSKRLGYKNAAGGGEYSLPRLLKFGVVSVGWALPGVIGAAQAATTTPSNASAHDALNQLLAFIYSIGHYIGEGIVRLINIILPSVPIPSTLTDPIGLLAILTIFLAVATVAKKLVWITVIVGWALIIIRIVLVIIQGHA